MTTPQENLYKAPEASLAKPVKGEHPILKFKRTSTWTVFLLTLVTFNIYAWYWIISRTKTASLVSKKTKMMPAYAAPALFAASLVLMFANISQTVTTIGFGLYFVAAITMLYSIFSLRNRLVEITNAGAPVPLKMGGIKTFFLHILFLNYRINKSIDLQRRIATERQQLVGEVKKAA